MIIKKIGEKAGLAVGIVALALGLFIVGSDLLGPNSRFFNTSKVVVGEIGGTDVEYEVFQKEVEKVKQIYLMNTGGKQPTEAEMPMINMQAWNQVVFGIANKQEFEKLGLRVSADELVDMVQGYNLHPAIRSMFANPQTGEVDIARIKEFLANLDQMDPYYRNFYTNLEANLPTERLREKYEKLLSMSTYVTEAEAKREYEFNNTFADVRYLHVSYNSVPDTTLGITDDKLKEYYNKNKSKYKVTANREIKYFSLPIQPTPEDAQLIFKETQDLVNTFAETQDDSAFVDANSDAKENFALLNVGNLPEQITMNGSLPEVGKVYGPFAEREAYKLFKVIGIKDDSLFSVRASHILIKPETEDAAGKAEAKKKATDILNKIKNGADFAQLASEFGTDGTASRGGDLGWFTEGTMVTPFNDAVFSAKLGLIPRIVETNFGFHVVKVTAEKTKKKYIVATITKDITPSDETRDIIYKRAAKYAAIKKQEDFLAALKADSTIRVDEDLNVDKKDRNLNTIYTPSVREIIRWTYSDDTEVGDVSDVFDLNDQFVVATLLKANEDDELDFELVKTQVRTDLVIELQKQEILAKLTPLKGSLDDIAKAYGANAYVYSAPNVTMSAGSLIGVGAAVESIGAIFGLKEGATSKPIADKYGVVMVSLNKINKVAEIADYSTQKNQIKTSATQSIITSAAKAIEKFYDIKDFTYKFF